MNNVDKLSSPLVSIVFSAYKMERYPYILKAIDTISKQTYRNFETIIVVDGNKDLYVSLSNLNNQDNGKWKNDIKLKILNNEKRGGPSVARNMGISEAKGDIVVITDDDVHVSQQWLENIIDSFDDDVLMVGGQILPDYGEGAATLPEEVLWIVGCTYKGHPAKRQKVRNVISANMAFRKNLFDVISFEPSYKGDWRMSDTLIGIKANEYRPGSVVYDPDSLVYHNVPKERTTLYYFAKRSYTEGFLKAFLKVKSKDKDLYSYESKYLATIISSILKYVSTFHFRYALINCIVLMSVGVGFSMGSLSKMRKGST